MSEAHDLHDLVQKVLAISREHPAYVLAQNDVWVFADTVTMRARLIEARQQLDQVRSQIPDDEKETQS